MIYSYQTAFHVHHCLKEIRWLIISLKWNFHNLIRISQTSNCFIVISIFLLEIDAELIRRFCQAARDGDVSLLTEMLDNGVPIDREYGIATALKYAAMMNRTDVTQMLLKRGADVDKRSGSF